MDLEIDPGSATPLYLQIVERVRRLLALDVLRPGQRLPPVRDIATRAGIHRNTVARAIRHLEREGLVRTRVGQGTFVAEPAPSVDLASRDDRLDRSIDRLIFEAVSLGVPLEEIGWRLARRVERHRRLRREVHLRNCGAE
jgi:GntR family transcriptional regulator